VAHYYDRLIDFLDHAVSERFLRSDHRSMLVIAEGPDELLDAFARYRPPTVEKWIDRSDT
jgi:predicted Rossmann-fold nucleotide-binding protein